MKLPLFVQKSSNLLVENRLLKFVVVVMGAATLYNSCMLSGLLEEQRTIIVPPGFESALEVRGKRVDSAYLNQMGRYVAALCLSHSPANARRQFEELLTLYRPLSFPAARAMFYEMADTIEATQTSSIFHIQRIVQDETKQRLEISGTRLLYVQDKKIEETSSTYALDYHIEGGRFWIVELSEKDAKR